MRWIDILRIRLRSLASRSSVDHELDEELQYHLDRQIDEYVAAGMLPGEARLAALRSIAGLEQSKEECRDMRGWNLLDNLWNDLRFSLRQLRKTPGFTSTAILLLALGMCASVAIFTFVDAALLKPLPYRDPTRLAGVFEAIPLFPRSNLSYFDYLDWKKLNTVFTSLDAYDHSNFILQSSAGPQPAAGARVSSGFFRTLGVSPSLGRDFRDGEDLPGAPRTVLLSYAAWQDHYGARADILGQSVTLNGDPYTVIGVLPAAFHFAPAEPAAYWITLNVNGSCEKRRGCHNLYGVGRLKDGVSLAAASTDLKAVARRLEQQYPATNRDQGAAIASLTEVIVGDLRPILLVLLGGAGLLLLIAAVNVTSLLLVRSESRKREIAVRSSLGASPARLLAQFVTEGVVLVFAGSALGLAAAWWAMRLLATLIPATLMDRMTFLHALAWNARVWTFAALVAFAAALLFSLIPALRWSLPDVRAGLAEGSRGSAGVVWRRLGARLVVVELATAVVLLVGAGLLGKSLFRLLHVSIGFEAGRLATLQVVFPPSGYSKDEQKVALTREIVSRLENLPGVKSVGLGSTLPVTTNGNTTWFRVLGRPWHGEHNEAPERDVSSGYFTTLGARLLRGRYFTEQDDASRPRVVIINQALARQYFPGEDPIGKQISYLSDPPKPIEIVGLIEDIKEGPLEVATVPALYMPFNQSPDSGFGLVVRTGMSGGSVIPALSAAIRQVDPGILTLGGIAMADKINDSAWLQRSSVSLVGSFAALALLLGVVGLYGVVAYSVSQRTREIGVRMALGAQRSSVYRLVLREAGRLIVFGVAIGLVCSIAAGTLIRGLLFGVSSWDVPTLAAVAAILAAAALLASFVPARRAAGVNPIEALRAD
jgi:macrolide transport system ATP-binding/permease protein